MASPKDRRRSERVPTAFIPVQLSDVNGELIDLSLTGAAVIHRSPVKPGAAATLIFPSYGGIYIPCEVLRSIVQVRRGERSEERRVGKECRSRWSTDHEKKNNKINKRASDRLK